MLFFMLLSIGYNCDPPKLYKNTCSFPCIQTGARPLTVVEKEGRGLHDLQGAMKPFIDPQSKVYILFLLLLKIVHQ